MGPNSATERTYKDFPEALRELMKKRDFSFPKLAREVGHKLSTTYIHNLASGKSKPTKENIYIIAKGLKVDPLYFKEFREYEAKEKIDENPKIADLIADEKFFRITSEFATLSDEDKQKVAELIKEFKAKYRIGKDN